ncbi:MAG: Na(+)/H(+) antiporter subunit B [Acidobacteriota bacterium]
MQEPKHFGAVDPERVRRTLRPQPMHRKVIVRVVSKALIPYILLFGLYVQFHGDFGPGGGFQAGAIFAAGLVLYGLIYGIRPLRQAVPGRVLERLFAGGVLLYGGTGLASFLRGGNFLDYGVLLYDPIHARHEGLLLIELGVGLTVACVLTSIFYAFASWSPED